MNLLSRMKLKSKLRNCDYKLAGTVIKQQYYNENSQTEINRMIDHFMEQPCFERALDLIEYNEMIVFYFTESCTDGLYVRKTPSSSEVVPDSERSVETQSEQLTSYDLSSPMSIVNEDKHNTIASTEQPKKQSSTHSEHRQKIQESEEWMDEMISRLSKKPKQPAIPQTPTSKFDIPEPKVYNDAEAESFDTIEFKSIDELKDIKVFEDEYNSSEVRISPNKVVFEEPDIFPEPVPKPEPVVFVEPVAKPEPVIFVEPEVLAKPVIKPEPVVFVEPEVFAEPVIKPEPVVFVEPEVQQTSKSENSSSAFEFVASAQANEHLQTIDPAGLFDAPTAASLPTRKKRPGFPNVVATLKIDMHTMIKQLDEYRHELAYHPANEQQLINWIESLEKAIEEFSSAIDVIEDYSGHEY